MSENPFLHARNPYGRNPFAVLALKRNANSSEIALAAERVEEDIARGAGPVGLAVGDGQRAASALRDPVVRLAFDLMEFGCVLPEGEET
jgi:hypothetical protein